MATSCKIKVKIFSWTFKNTGFGTGFPLKDQKGVPDDFAKNGVFVHQDGFCEHLTRSRETEFFTGKGMVGTVTSYEVNRSGPKALAFLCDGCVKVNEDELAAAAAAKMEEEGRAKIRKELKHWYKGGIQFTLKECPYTLHWKYAVTQGPVYLAFEKVVLGAWYEAGGRPADTDNVCALAVEAARQAYIEVQKKLGREVSA